MNLHDRDQLGSPLLDEQKKTGCDKEFEKRKNLDDKDKACSSASGCKLTGTLPGPVVVAAGEVVVGAYGILLLLYAL